MTDKELAEQYAKENSIVYYHPNGEPMFTREEDLKFAFLAGHRAGRPQWHNLRENPNDLPEPYMSVINQNGRNVLYDYIHKVWRYDDANEYICDTPIVWCEVPTYSEEVQNDLSRIS